ncbi:MAG TPA: hypothetical protein VFV58_01955 [Blastocatellia bacterium]|jgi:hypothetical protein|nr:hypothetical protein [Blastocatellia bacterium]
MNKNPNKSGEAPVVNEPEGSKSENSRDTLVKSENSRDTLAKSENSRDTLANAITASSLINVKLTRASGVPSPGDLGDDKIFWTAIRNRTEAINFDNYSRVIDHVLCDRRNPSGPTCKDQPKEFTEVGTPSIQERRDNLLDDFPSIYGVDAYNLLKLATQAFLLFETGIVIRPPRLGPDTFLPEEQNRYGDPTTNYDNANDPNSLTEQLARFLGGDRKIPYLRRIVDALVSAGSRHEGSPFCEGLLKNRFSCPSMLELSWSFWEEQGMLVQTMNAIALRFQNKRGPADHDPLANLELDPLRPLNTLIWGFIQDEYNRLTVARRAYEYDHQYGLKMYGKAIPNLRSAESRSKFLEAFHNLLYRASLFYREDADTTVIADGFPLLNSLREVHLLLAEGAHNQFSDLPWTARAEMLMMQWMLARPEMREFLRGRAMVPYNERWMGQVDTMKRLQGWTPDTSITHFRNLAIYSEQILLSVRYGDWIDINDQEQAKTWARYWRPEIQGYIHAYQAATGVDLSDEVVDTRRAALRYVQPAVLLRDQLAAQWTPSALPSAPADRALTAGGINFSASAGFRRRRLNPIRED